MARRTLIAVVVAAFLIALAVPAGAAGEPVDLSTWAVHDHPYEGPGMAGDGVWVVSTDGLEVDQTFNGSPTFFYSDMPVDGFRITATFETPTTDNDFFGIALGFSPSADEYLLIDWRQSYQDIQWGEGIEGVQGTPGLAVSRVWGTPKLNEFWGHVDSSANGDGGLEELARGATLGSTGWADDASYDFVVEYTTTSLEIWVDGVQEVSLTGDFPSGPMALYNFSQPGMTMSGLTTEQLNTPPQVGGSGANDVIVDEGSVGSTTGVFTDVDGDPLTLTCSGPCSGFTDNGDGTWSWSRVLPEGPYEGSVIVTASDGLEAASDPFDVTVNNLAPVITSTTSLVSGHDIDDELPVTADFTDAGVLDTHTATLNWGDGTSTSASVVETDGVGTVSGTHAYTSPGTYVVSVTVWDDDGASDSAVLGEVFVFDPDDFVTGGGWIQSPAGAYAPDSDQDGRATFGFVARYNRDWDVTGSLQFQLHRGMNFHATDMDYLFISNGVAVFEGDGRLNGQPGYQFRVVATDERHATSAKDLFWITIEGPSGTVYDGTALAGGLPVQGRGIQVHDR